MNRPRRHLTLVPWDEPATDDAATTTPDRDGATSVLLPVGPDPLLRGPRVARAGAEEFVAVLSGTLQEVQAAAGRLCFEIAASRDQALIASSGTTRAAHCRGLSVATPTLTIVRADDPSPEG